MGQTPHVWTPGCEHRVQQAVQELGFPSLIAYLSTMPSHPYDEIAKLLGSFAPIQIVSVHFQEARDLGCVRDAAKDALCRHLSEYLPGGWNVGEGSGSNLAIVLGGWMSEVEVSGECEGLGPQLLAIAKALRALPPPKGWLPTGPDDPIFNRVFDSEWPVGL